jgi:hypothetical protein
MKKVFYTPFVIALCMVLFIGCNKDVEPIDPTPVPVGITYISAQPSNLNVVYFIPKDKFPLANYQRRISGIMLHTQAWYKKEMNSYGFGEKTFGLLVAEKDIYSVKIIIINGTQNADFYPYDGGGTKAETEIKAYFNNHPSESSSDHTVVFMPSRTGEHGWDAGGVPFYGIGKWCYALDYTNFDMSTWRDGTQEGSTNWIGGTIHEIGHALNLPHNQHKANDGWISMMSWGNHEYNNDPENVHLTKASAVILNNNQVFNNQPASNFYTEIPTHTIKSLRIYADNTNLYVRCKFDVSIAINGVTIYNDPKTSIDDADYNAVSWATTNLINNDSISVVMPLSGINQDYKQYPFELRIRFCHTNGNFSHEVFQYNFDNGRPDIDIEVVEIVEADKSAWTIAGFSSEEAIGEGAGNGRAIYAIDDNNLSFWHSAWSASQPNYPHSFTVNLNINQQIKGFTFLHRAAKYNGRPKDITIETSIDGLTFQSLGDFILGDDTARQLIALTTPVTARYFKIIVNSGHDDNGGENVFFTHLAEVGLY